jgi:hypothetical protein
MSKLAVLKERFERALESHCGHVFDVVVRKPVNEYVAALEERIVYLEAVLEETEIEYKD